MNKLDKEYHVRQYKEINRSTEVFVEWIETLGFIKEEGEKILDMACGAGANTLYMANKFRKSQFIGIDSDKENIDFGNEQISVKSYYNNCKLYVDDWFNLNIRWRNEFSGIISFQALSWLSEYEKPIYELASLNPKWVAISSLFYEGDIDYIVKVKDYYRAEDGKAYQELYYNIYSLVQVRKCFESQGYCNFQAKKFDIDIDLPKPKHLDIGTYTIKTLDGKRIQISGGLMMPWYFIIAYK